MPEERDDEVGVPAALQALVGIVLGSSTLEDVLQRTCEIAKSTIPGAHEVSVTLIDQAAPRTVAFSGELALRVDESQYAAGYGPCLDAARLGVPIVVADLHHEDRWPDYVPAALESGVRASVSVPLRVDDNLIGALNVYSPEAKSLDAKAERTAVELAQHAGAVLTNANNYYRATSLAEQMQTAMQSRAVIEQAKGILMAQRRCGPEEAFDLLVRLSQESRNKLRDVAQGLVDRVIEA
jgi:GAF domain-containing protein